MFLTYRYMTSVTQKYLYLPIFIFFYKNSKVECMYLFALTKIAIPRFFMRKNARGNKK